MEMFVLLLRHFRRVTRRAFLPALALGLLVLLSAPAARAFPTELRGSWTEVSGPTPKPVARPATTGGAFAHEAAFDIERAGRYVIDFRNGHVLGRFEHVVRDAQGRHVARFDGGLAAGELGPFFLRHGRELRLEPGRYSVHTRLESPYFIAPPQPYLDTLAHYRGAITAGNALALAGLGVFIGLGTYYACLSLVRRRRAEALYALFIAGNLAFNLGSLGAARDLFGIGWFHLTSVPVLLSNMAYVAFVMALLDLRRTLPGMHRLGRALLGLLAAFALGAAWQPQWALEFARYGVGVFLLYGFACGAMRARAGDRLARLYLVANGAFAVVGFAALTFVDMGGLYTFTVEHVGLAAVAIEVLLLALVLSFQFGELQRSTAEALARAEANLRLAHTDALTGLPNRHALAPALDAMGPQATLTIIDLDGLKQVNDAHGHAQGDRLLRDFALEMSRRLGALATLHRLGGDEFAAVAPGGDAAAVAQALDDTVQALQHGGYRLLGASCGHVRCSEAPDAEALQNLADLRMYRHKSRRRSERGAVAPAPGDPSVAAAAPEVALEVASGARAARGAMRGAGLDVGAG